MIAFAVLLDLAIAIVGCRQKDPAPSAAASAGASAPAAPASSGPPAEPPRVVSSALSDRELGRLIEGLSEPSGDFPSDNYVSNETSYLHPAKELRAAPRGGAYVGVGPEQNFSYLALTEPELAFIVDIRRQNMLQHLVYKAIFQHASGRAGFVAALVGKEVPKEPLPEATLDEVLGVVAAAPKAKTREARTWTVELAGSLGVTLTPADEKHLDKILAAFEEKGLELRYSMKGSARAYPSLRELLRTGDDEGRPAGFLGTDAAFRVVQRMSAENRIVPLVGDFAGKKTLQGIAKELTDRKLPLRLFYVSNVEQYVFDPKPWAQWRENLRAMPWADDGKILRVYFDQGRKHPLQREGHRTVSMLRPAKPFLDRLGGKGFRSFWEVATE